MQVRMPLAAWKSKGLVLLKKGLTLRLVDAFARISLHQHVTHFRSLTATRSVGATAGTLPLDTKAIVRVPRILTSFRSDSPK